MISDETNHKQHDMLSFTMKMKEMHERQQREIEWAIIDKGPFQLHPSLRHLQVPETEWFVNMTKEERVACVSRVLNMDTPAKSNSDLSEKASDLHLEPSCADDCVNVEKERPSPGHPRQSQTIASDDGLSIDLEGVKMYDKDAGSFSVEGMYKKASESVAVPGNITAAPGCHTDAKVVTSRSGVKPHVVMPGKAKGQFVCEPSCVNWKSYAICSHVLATAHSANKLLLFLQWYAKSGAKKVNLTNAARVGTSLHPDQKGCVGLRKRSVSKSTPLETHPRPIFQTTPTSETTVINTQSTQVQGQQSRGLRQESGAFPFSKQQCQSEFQTAQCHFAYPYSSVSLCVSIQLS